MHCTVLCKINHHPLQTKFGMMMQAAGTGVRGLASVAARCVWGLSSMAARRWCVLRHDQRYAYEAVMRPCAAQGVHVM